MCSVFMTALNAGMVLQIHMCIPECGPQVDWYTLPTFLSCSRLDIEFVGKFSQVPVAETH